jgi:hypothetical protein
MRVCSLARRSRYAAYCAADYTTKQGHEVHEWLGPLFDCGGSVRYLIIA